MEPVWVVGAIIESVSRALVIAGGVASVGEWTEIFQKAETSQPAFGRCLVAMNASAGIQ